MGCNVEIDVYEALGRMGCQVITASCTVYSPHTCCVLPTHCVHILLSRFFGTGIEPGRFETQG